MAYEIKPHSRYVSIWRDGFRIAKVPIARWAGDRYGLEPAWALTTAARIVAALQAAEKEPASLRA